MAADQKQAEAGLDQNLVDDRACAVDHETVPKEVGGVVAEAGGHDAAVEAVGRRN